MQATTKIGVRARARASIKSEVTIRVKINVKGGIRGWAVMVRVTGYGLGLE